MKSEIKMCEDAIKLAKEELKEWSKFLAMALIRLIKLKKTNERCQKNKTVSSKNRKRVA